MSTRWRYLGILLVLLLSNRSVPAQESQVLYVTLGGGVMHITSDYDVDSWYERDDVGYVGRIGMQSSVLNARLRLGAELEYGTYLADYRGPMAWCNWGPEQGGGRCDPERTTIRSLNVRGQWALSGGQPRYRPYVSFGTGWMRVPTNRDPETFGPKTDIGLGLAFDPFGNGLLSLAIEPRYTFFYFPDDWHEDLPNQVSVALVSTVRVVRW